MLDSSGRWPPVLLELKVDLRTQRDEHLFDRLSEFCREAVGDCASLRYLDADRLAILLPQSDVGQVERFMEQLRQAWGVEVQRLRIDTAADSVPVAERAGWYEGVPGLKRWAERFFAAVGLVVVAPLLLLLALTVKISRPGPVLSVHDRRGRDGRRCRVYRFRAQTIRSTVKRPALIDGYPNAGGRLFRNPPRAMSVDRLLTETRLHRLPQLWNVVRGELPLRSLTGSRIARTRPHGHPGVSAPNRF
jgi:lipopolysaccharide/colanic/teichoic acid biosynthesis glycosyltransferase